MPAELGKIEVVATLTAIGILSGWLISGYLVSKKKGTRDAQIENLFIIVDKHDCLLADMKKSHDEDMAAIRAFFSTENGGQKFMTFPDHATICLLNSKSTIQEIGHLTKAVQDLTTLMSAVSAQVSALRVSVAVLQENKNIRDNDDRGRRIGD